MSKQVRCKITLDIETEFDDNESDTGTLLFCLQEDINDQKIYTIHSACIDKEDNA